MVIDLVVFVDADNLVFVNDLDCLFLAEYLIQKQLMLFFWLLVLDVQGFFQGCFCLQVAWRALERQAAVQMSKTEL